jgi:hypothetical protein
MLVSACLQMNWELLRLPMRSACKDMSSSRETTHTVLDLNEAAVQGGEFLGTVWVRWAAKK